MSNQFQTPKSVEEAISVSVRAMLVPLAIPASNIEAALRCFFDELSGRGTRTLTETKPLDRVLTVAQTATLLARSKKTVLGLANRGLIRRVYCGASSQRASGYSEASVRAFIAGTTKEA